MPIVSGRMYRNHVIHICPALINDVAGDAVVSIVDPNGEEWWSAEAHGTEAGMFYHAEGVIDEEIPETESEKDDPDGPYAQRWRSQHSY